MDATDMIIAEGRVVGAVRLASGLGGEFASILEVRQLAALTPEEFNAAVTALYCAQAVNLIPRSRQSALTPADREAAVHVGGEAKHLVAWTA